MSSPVFVGKRWTLETRKGGRGYVTCAITAKTKAYNDPSYPSSPGLIVPSQIEQRIRKMMRATP